MLIKIENDSDSEDPFCPSPDNAGPPEICTSTPSGRSSSQARRTPKQFKILDLPTGVTGFDFPLTDDASVERLEAAVRSRREVRMEYIHFLQVMKPKSVGVVDIFRTLFADAALMNFNFSGLCHKGISLDSSRRKAMKNYAIFWDCLLEAWKDHGVNPNILRECLKQVMKKLHKRKRSRKYNDKMKQKKLGIS